MGVTCKCDNLPSAVSTTLLSVPASYVRDGLGPYLTTLIATAVLCGGAGALQLNVGCKREGGGAGCCDTEHCFQHQALG